MKYFIDTEFIEGFKKPLFGKRRHFIDLISIGIVCEDGREYYAISNEFNAKDADEWVKENVISKLPERRVNFSDHSISPNSKFKAALWKSNKQIAKEIEQFCKPNETKALRAGIDAIIGNIDPNIEFYAYYADYDWVVFCSMFGRMIDLPKGFPMYCKDLKQMVDERAENTNQIELTRLLVKNDDWTVTTELPKALVDICDYSFYNKLQLIKAHPNYPKQENEHNALADAKWNKKLYEFLTNL